MCGIFGYYNFNVPRDRAAILQLLINGLRRLEYRGYDSAGICIDSRGTVSQFPHTTPNGNIRQTFSRPALPNGNAPPIQNGGLLCKKVCPCVHSISLHHRLCRLSVAPDWHCTSIHLVPTLPLYWEVKLLLSLDLTPLDPAAIHS